MDLFERSKAWRKSSNVEWSTSNKLAVKVIDTTESPIAQSMYENRSRPGAAVYVRGVWHALDVAQCIPFSRSVVLSREHSGVVVKILRLPPYGYFIQLRIPRFLTSRPQAA